MIDSTIPLIMLALFLVGTLLLGLKYKKGHNGIIGYTIGNKKLTTATLIATVLATACGSGGIMRTVEMIYADGLWYIMFIIGGTIVYYLVCIIVTSRIGLFIENHIPLKNHISIADTMGHIYGRIPRIVTALAAVGTSTTAVATQITVTSRALQICISDVNPSVLMVISASIVILYSAFGGIRSVVTTDMLQCATFTIIIPYISCKVFDHTGMSVSQIFNMVPQLEKFQFTSICQNKTKILSLIAAWLACVGIYPASVQRMYMARNGQQARKVYFTSAILDCTILLIVVFLGIITCAGYSHVTDSSMIWPAIISNSSAIFKGSFLVSLFSMAMSTADSCLNVASSMFAHDVVNPLCRNRLTDKQQLYLAKIACFVIGVFSIALALFTSKYKDALLRLLFLTLNIGNPICTAPFLLAIWGFRCKEKIAVLGMVVGVITMTLWKRCIPDIDGSFVAMLANGITMLLAHYSMPGKDRKDWTKPSLDYR